MKYVSTPVEIADAPLNDMERQVLGYWESGREGAFAPPWSRFRLDDLPPRAIPWCSVVDVIAEPLDFIVRFWGSARRDLYGHEITGKRVSAGDNPVSTAVFAQSAEVVRRRQPTYFRIVANRDDGAELEYSFLRLPISDDGEQVGKVFSISYQPTLKDELHILHGTQPPTAMSWSRNRPNRPNRPIRPIRFESTLAILEISPQKFAMAVYSGHGIQLSFD